MSATRIEILASGAQTATAQGGAIAVGNMKELGVMADVTVASGTLTVYLQSSSDGGTTWFDLPYDLALVTAATAAAGTATASNRNIHSSITATAKAMAQYAKFGDLVRGAWVISGSGATFTFSIKAVGKN